MTGSRNSGIPVDQARLVSVWFRRGLKLIVIIGLIFAGQIIARYVATELNFDLSLTHSCYAPAEDGSACGICDSCGLRKRGFEEAGVKDPTRYAENG